MKINEKTFNIYEEKRPKVLLLGNGICQAFGGMSWNRLLDEIKDKDLFPNEARAYVLPMPLKAALLTNNSLATKMLEIVQDEKTQDGNAINWSSFTKTTPEMRDMIRRFIGCGFDYVLTTNYSYEIEAALMNRPELNAKQIGRMMNYHEVNHAQTKFLTNTFNLAGSVQVWHIHGEARKPGSMVIGNYYYGKMLARCVARLDGGKESDGKKQSGKMREYQDNIREGKAQKIGSWIDAFVLGDVTICGFGLDFSETDLWWLIEYKSNHPQICGKTVFYEPMKDSRNRCLIDAERECSNRPDYVNGSECRELLLGVHGVETRNLNVKITGNEDYKTFYAEVLKDIESTI